MIRVAVGESPRNSAYLDSLGWVLYKKGQFADAKHWLVWGRRGMNGDDPVICDHLGDTLWRLGEKEEAVQSWKDGLELARKRLRLPPAGSADLRSAATLEAKLNAAENGQVPKLADVVGAVVETTNSE